MEHIDNYRGIKSTLTRGKKFDSRILLVFFQLIEQVATSR